MPAGVGPRLHTGGDARPKFRRWLLARLTKDDPPTRDRPGWRIIFERRRSQSNVIEVEPMSS